MQSAPGDASFEKELSAAIKDRLENPQDNTAKTKIVKKINDFLEKFQNITHGDFNTQFTSVLKSLNIKPTEFEDPKVVAPSSVNPAQGNLPLK
jgi:hypothetical protein